MRRDEASASFVFRPAFSAYLIVAFLFILGLYSPSSARIRGIAYTDKELAARGATIHVMLLDLARQDAAVSAPAFAKMAARTWAYQSLGQIIGGKTVEKLPPPPNPEGWRQLIGLLVQARLFEEGLQVLEVEGSQSAFDEPERLLLEVAFLNFLDRRSERASARLLDILKENPLAAGQLVQRWWMEKLPPFRNSDDEFPFEPQDDVQTEIFLLLRPAIRETQFSRDKKFDTWTLTTPEAAPGQEILIEGEGSVKPKNWKRAVFLQNGKTYSAGHRRAGWSKSGDGGLYHGNVVFGVPEEMTFGPAKIMLGDVGQFDLNITSSPAPARIQSVSPDRAVPGDWMSIYSVGLQANRRVNIHVSEIEKTAIKEWPVAAIFTQGGREWTVERSVQTWRGFIQDQLVFRVPGGLATGKAQVKLKLVDSISEPRLFAVSTWPALEDLERADRSERLIAIPNSTMTLVFNRGADAYAAVVEPPSGRHKIWRPQVQPVPGQIYSESKWRVPKEWEVGVHDVVWAARVGGLWSIPDLFGETLTVSPFAPAPEGLQAVMIRAAEEGTITTLGTNGYESLKFGKGDILIQGEGIEKGETYDISVRFAAGNVFSTRRVSAHDWVTIINVNPAGPAPEYVEVSRVIGGIAGMPANVRVQEYGGVMGDLFTAQTKEGQEAVEWLTGVRAKLRAARFEDQPSLKQILSTLRIDTFPLSPWGGPWMYVRTPGHPSLTFLAHDWYGILKAQFYSGGIGAGLVEYDLLTKGETHGVVTGNLYWTSPWATNGLGNLVTDAMRAAGGADVAVHNTLGLRGNIPAGPVTDQIMTHILPFDNGLIVLHLKGADFIELLKDAFASGKYLYPSGMTFEVDSGPRAVEVTVNAGFGKVFSKDAVYRVAMPSYLAEKRAGYPKTEAALKTEDDGKTVRDAVEEYLKKKSPIIPDRVPRVIERTR